ncbi:hypothetical protein [Lactobacillus helveticus]|uniref:hypothetical protein n=1 Tax=Lactobacillus helveticus TaxID=1587 RepID=UPI00156246E2|nr:hypothetical protein [Lactobacillus helveticus]
MFLCFFDIIEPKIEGLFGMVGMLLLASSQNEESQIQFFESLPIGTISSGAITHSSDLNVLRMAISTLNITLLNTNECIKNCFLRQLLKKRGFSNG